MLVFSPVPRGWIRHPPLRVRLRWMSRRQAFVPGTACCAPTVRTVRLAHTCRARQAAPVHFAAKPGAASSAPAGSCYGNTWAKKAGASSRTPQNRGEAPFGVRRLNSHPLQKRKTQRVRHPREFQSCMGSVRCRADGFATRRTATYQISAASGKI